MTEECLNTHLGFDPETSFNQMPLMECSLVGIAEWIHWC